MIGCGEIDNANLSSRGATGTTCTLRRRFSKDLRGSRRRSVFPYSFCHIDSLISDLGGC